MTYALWHAATAKYLKARREAATPTGIEYAARLAAMPPDDAARELYNMFALCFDEDLKEDTSCDLQLPYTVAAPIAEAIICLRTQRGEKLSSRKNWHEIQNQE
jgi:hypothetical protein